jgi:1-acyl-sn-glycerol-3-phosphate acyltransferase
VILYRIVRRIFWVAGKVMWRLSIEGSENVPTEGPFVLAPVHRSNIDFAMISCVTERKMRFMGKDSLWKVRWFGRFITILGAYPVHRKVADREALRSTIEILKGGEPLVLFPEGTRRSGPRIENLYEGAAYVAARAGVPLVPVGVGGSERALPRGSRIPRPVKVHLIVGPPLYPPPTPEGRRNPSRRAVHELTLRLQEELQRLFDLAQARAGAI